MRRRRKRWFLALVFASLPATLLALGGCGDNAHRGADAGPGQSDGGGEPDAGGNVVVTCPDPVPAAQDGVCDVTAGQGSAVLVRGTVLGAGTVYQNGGVLYDGDKITCVGCDCATAAGGADATRVDCAGGVISPGLINPHDHMTFSEGAPTDHGDTRYDHRHDWRGSLPAPQNAHGTGASSAGTRWVELRQLLAGTTSMVGSGSATGLVRNLDRLSDGDKALGFKEVDFETFSLGDGNEEFHPDCTWNYKVDERKAAKEPAFIPHVAEGINDYAAEEFRCQSTSFGGGQDFTESNDSFIHAIGLKAADYYTMARRGTRLIWSPRSNVSLYGETADVSTFARLGGTIALGTDWSYSGSINILRELACADQLNSTYLDHVFTDEDLWKMATINAAVATDSDSLIGSLESGKLADIAVFAGSPDAPFRAVVGAGNQDVALVVQGGAPLYGETDVISGLGAECETMDLCGSPRAVCLSGQFGETYADLASQVQSGTAAYPAFFCDAPPGEPSCVPARPGEFTGQAASGDADGDGIADADDDCPAVFNPIRPIDGGAQADGDGDGMGDACDPTPVGDDIDGDGVPNTMDDCPRDANSDQTDSDSDGRGDACDYCPDESNPRTVCGLGPPMDTTIEAIQMGSVQPGTNVTIHGAVVIGVWGSGAWVEDPSGATAYAGVHVFTGGNPGVAVGDVVDASGTVVEYFDDTEIDSATISKTGSGGVVTAVDVTAAQAADEMYEGMLVRITDVTDVVNPYDCSADNAACADMNLWEINGQVVAYDRLYQDADWTAHAGQGPVTGVMATRFDRRRIMPRTAADFGP